MDDKVLRTLEFHKVLEQLARHAATSMGKSLCLALRPSAQLAEAVHQLAETEEAVSFLRLNGHPPFGGIRDVRASARRAELGGMLQPHELIEIADTLHGCRKLRDVLQRWHAEKFALPKLAAWFQRMTAHPTVERAIRESMDEQGEILDAASRELAAIRREIRHFEHSIRQKLESMIRTPAIQKMLQDALISMRGDRYVIPVKAEYRAHFRGIVHDQSSSGATLFIEPEVIVSMNNRLRELQSREKEEIEKILRRLSGLVAEIAESLAGNVDMAGQLDFVFAKALYAHETGGTKPLLNDRGRLKLRKARHPLIPAEQVVPIDVELGKTYHTIIITGPNTGGKTVSLKTIGLLSLMGMSGLFVPADEESELCVFEGVFADIGDEQSIEQSLSTFSSHMTNIIRILRQATPQSLILLDELGAGTDPAEGSALAIALLEHLHAMGCRIVATTHYSELKAYAYNREGVINASMEFHIDTLQPTYRLLVGIPGRSNAFAIAERLGLPASIIERARQEMNLEDRKVESMIASLESNRLSAEEEYKEARRQREEAERLLRGLEEQTRRLTEQKRKWLEKARQEAEEAVAKAKREAEAMIAELRKMAMEEKTAIREHKLIAAKQRLDAAVRHLADSGQDGVEPSETGASSYRPQPGDEVLVTSLNQKGHVLDVGEKEATVQIGILKLKIGLHDMRPSLRSEPTPVPVPAAILTRTGENGAKLELDVRGARLEDALIEVDQHISQALLAGFSQISIIHGKGTGALRKGIQDYLRSHKHVKRFRLGQYGEGDSGVTIAELK